MLVVAGVLVVSGCAQVVGIFSSAPPPRNEEVAAQVVMSTLTPTPLPPPTATPVPPRKRAVLSYTGEEVQIAVAEEEAPGHVAPQHVVDVDASYQHPLFQEFVSVSPDGQQVLYVTSAITQPLNNVIWVAEVAGGGKMSIAHFSDHFWSAAPVWSPSSSHIAYVTKALGSAPNEGLRLWTMRRDGSEKTVVVEGGAFRPSLFLGVPQGVIGWSGDGSSLTFRDRWAQPPQLYRVDLVSGNIIQTDARKEPDVAEELFPPHAVGTTPCTMPVYNQKNYDAFMYPCGQRINRAGCAVTAATMLLGYYGIHLDPPTLNACLGELACPLWWWDVAQRCGQGEVRGVGFLEPFSYQTIDDDLAQGRPVIVLLTAKGTHFVVITGGSGQYPGGYTIHDPVDGSFDKTLADYADNGWTLNQLYRYTGTPACPDAQGEDPDGGTLMYGQATTGTIYPNDYDDYTFPALPGEQFEVQVYAQAPNFDPVIGLYHPNDWLVALDDDGGGDTHSLLRYTVPVTPTEQGIYRLRVRGYGGSAGPYHLELLKEQ